MDVIVLLMFTPIGLTILCSGLFTNLLQASCFVLLRPLSKRWWSRLIGPISQILLLNVTFLLEWWACFKIEIHTDLNTQELMGKEHAILIPNHICDVDILYSWLLAQRSGCLSSAFLVIKDSAKYLPIFGWSFWFFGCIFLKRNWEKDEEKLKASLQALKDYPRHFWLTIFVEGTRMTPQKLLLAQQFAISKRLPVPRNVLIPRTKGFVSVIKHSRSFVSAVYDVTFAVPDGYSLPSVYKLIRGEPCLVQVHIKRYPVKELPESDEAIAQWCRDRFVAKDAMLEKYRVNGTFDDPITPNFGRALKSLIAACLNAGFTFVVVLKCCQVFSLLSTWKGNAILATGLLTIWILTQIFIDYTKSPQQGMTVSPEKLK